MPAQLSSLFRSPILTIWFSVSAGQRPPRSVNSLICAAKAVLGARVEKSKAESLRKELSARGLVDKTLASVDDGNCVVIPLTGEPPRNLLAVQSATVVDRTFPTRKHTRDPIDIIVETAPVPDHLVQSLPRKWELFGDVLVLRLDRSLDSYEEPIAKSYASVLGAKTVLRDVGGISGEFRRPELKKILGEDTVTVHVENEVKFRFDVSQIMFSSGNMEERIRMAELKCDDETVVDMFAGIGYFSIPLAVYQKPKRVLACEINPVAHAYLKENIRMNGVYGTVHPVLGDNRDLLGADFADRVIMGYVKTTHEFLPTAMRVVKSGGVIHYHETCPNELLPDRPPQRIRDNAKGCRVEIERLKEIKSYAPGISHVVVDARVFKPV
jgi:tRNA wybutosine-synthesizing protein 2